MTAPRCALVDADGTLRELRASQTDAHVLLACKELTMVGALDSLGVFAVGRRDAAALPVNPACANPRFFDAPVRGPVLFVATNARGDEMDVDVERLVSLLRGSDVMEQD